MKLLMSIILSMFSICTYSQADTYDVGRFYEGYIIKNDQSKERGFIEYLPEDQRYEKVVFKAEKDGKKKRFKFGDIAGYKVADSEFKAVEYDDVIFKGRRFLIVDQLGCINTYHFTQYNVEDAAWSVISVFENDEGAVNYQKFALNFAEKMANLVKAQPELAEKVRNKEKGYGLLKMYDIVDEFNANCQD